MGTRRNGENSRERILDAAEHLFRERGFHGVSLIDVAQAVRMRKPSLYHHFPNGKEELFLSVHDRMFARMGGVLGELLGSVERSVGDDENLLENGLHAASRWFLEQPPMFLLSMLHHDMPGLREETRTRLIQASYGVIMRPLVELVQRAAERGDAGPINPYIVAGNFLSVFEGTVIAAQTGLGDDVQTMLAESVNLLVYGATPRNAKLN